MSENDGLSPATAVARAVEALGRGEAILVVDDVARENEGDVVMWAGSATPERVNFMVREARGLVCAPMPEARAKALSLPPMVVHNTDTFGTAFTVSVDAAGVTTTGISAADRSATLMRLADPTSGADGFLRPGHIFPLEARPGGVLERAGHTEAAVDLLTMAGLYPVGAICEVMRPDGNMARRPDLEEFATRHGMVLVTIADLIRVRRDASAPVARVGEAALPTRYGTFRVIAYEEPEGHDVHLAVVKGEPERARGPVLVRVHSECMTGDVFGSLRCDCGEQLLEALERIERAGTGIVLYLRQEGRGIGLAAKIRAYALQEQGRDTVEANLELGYPADARSYGVAAAILRDLHVERVALMTNNPAKLDELRRNGFGTAERVAIEVAAEGALGRRYLETKRDKLGHLLLLGSTAPHGADRAEGPATEAAASREATR